jgi:hypothetical protein
MHYVSNTSLFGAFIELTLNFEYLLPHKVLTVVSKYHASFTYAECKMRK